MKSAAPRRLGPFEVAPIGLGCMNLSHAYGHRPPPEAAERLLRRAVELGVTYFDSAALYGFGGNEELLGRVLSPHRDRIVLASKCGMTGVDGKRVIDGRPETLERTCEESLRRLRTETIDLYYLHRWDKRVPIEESVGALARLVGAGKLRAIGLSEVSVATLKKAQAVHPIAAVQSEYSLFTRDPERELLLACHELGAALVAFSPLGRGLLAGSVTGAYAEDDIRHSLPRFHPPHLHANLALAMGPRLAAQVETEVPPLVPGAKPATVERVKVHGTALEGNLEGNAVDRDMIVFLPPSYAKEKSRRYPVVYALHGYSIGAEPWSHEIHVPQTIEGAFAEGAQEMIVVLPDSKTVHNGSMSPARQHGRPIRRTRPSTSSCRRGAASPEPTCSLSGRPTPRWSSWTSTWGTCARIARSRSTWATRTGYRPTRASCTRRSTGTASRTASRCTRAPTRARWPIASRIT